MNENTDRKKLDYSAVNPPPSDEDAKSRAEMLETEIELIKTALEVRTSAEFGSQSEYVSWRIRAAGSIGWKNTELKFVHHWLDEKRAAQALAELEEWVKKRAAEIGYERKAYHNTPLSGQDEIARAKSNVLQKHAHVCSSMTVFAAMAKTMRVPHISRQQIKAPLTKMLNQAVHELQVLKSRLSDAKARDKAEVQKSQTVSRHKRYALLADRLKEQTGLKMTNELVSWLNGLVEKYISEALLPPEDRERLRHIRKYIRGVDLLNDNNKSGT